MCLLNSADDNEHEPMEKRKLRLNFEAEGISIYS